MVCFRHRGGTGELLVQFGPASLTSWQGAGGDAVMLLLLLLLLLRWPVDGQRDRKPSMKIGASFAVD